MFYMPMPIEYSRSPCMSIRRNLRDEKESSEFDFEIRWQTVFTQVLGGLLSLYSAELEEPSSRYTRIIGPVCLPGDGMTSKTS